MAAINEKTKKICLQRIAAVITALNIRFGEMNIEILLDKDDNVHFLELGPRAGGNMIPIQLSDAFGIDLVKANVQAAIGVKPDFVDKYGKKPFPVAICIMSCIVMRLEHSAMLEIDESIRKFVYREVIYKKPGDKIEVFDGVE